MRHPKLFLAAIALVGTTAAATAAHDLTGRWNLAVVTENGTGYPVLQLTQTGDSLKGTYTSNAMGNRTITGIVYGDSMRFVLSSSMGGEGVVLTYLAKIVSPDSLDGAVDFGGMGGAKFHGARQK
jgi:hypothetical protein